jgi:hypothetical protein
LKLFRVTRCALPDWGYFFMNRTKLRSILNYIRRLKCNCHIITPLRWRRLYMMSCMVGKSLLLQGSISNLTCRIDFDSTQFDLDTCSCRFVHRIAHRKNIFKTMQQSSLRWRWIVDKWYHTRIKQNYEVSKTCAAPPRKIKKHNKCSLGQRSKTGKIILTVCVSPNRT